MSVTARGFAAAIVALISIQVLSADTTRLNFTGLYLHEPRTGLTAIPDDTGEHVILSSTTHHFWVVLPYSESWTFETGKNLPLNAQNEQYTVTIRAEPKKKENSEEFLRGIVPAEEGTPPDASTVEVHGRTILRYRAEGTDPSTSNAWTYISVTPRKNRWYVLRLTLEYDETIDRATEERILDILGAGFGADFQLD